MSNSHSIIAEMSAYAADVVKVSMRRASNLLDEIEALQEAQRAWREEVDTLRRKVSDLESTNNALRIENNNLCARLTPPSTVLLKTPADLLQEANQYMADTGLELARTGHKIPCIKQVYKITGWSLKESKDFVEKYGKEHEVAK